MLNPALKCRLLCLLLAFLGIFLLLTAPVRAAHKAMIGSASFYGKSHQGRRMADGKRFDKRRLTAAMLKVPFGTRCKVTSLSSHKSVIVEVTDRGPYVKGRIVDLSEAAAATIGLRRKGHGRVRIDILHHK